MIFKNQLVAEDQSPVELLTERVSTRQGLQDLSSHRITSPRIEVERERHYFLPRSVADACLNLAELPAETITQSYLPKDSARPMLARLAEASSQEIADSKVDILQARVRRSVGSNGGSNYEFTVKLREAGQPLTEKTEVTLSLSPAEYRVLEAHATRGSITKQRFYLPVNHDLTLEIDLPVRQSRNGRVCSLERLQYVMIDVEVSDPVVMSGLREGSIQIEIPGGALDISRDVPWFGHLRDQLSWKRLARSGVTREVKEALVALHSHYRELSAAMQA